MPSPQASSTLTSEATSTIHQIQQNLKTHKIDHEEYLLSMTDAINQLAQSQKELETRNSELESENRRLKRKLNSAKDVVMGLQEIMGGLKDRDEEAIPIREQLSGVVDWMFRELKWLEDWI
ncbi:hypothetical protein GLAREA_06976 [Glarea lozoyensis ATCC 20868]|uniref:Uncharacterized protein n=1 Tax=Glarea lozoyensis (strain ATCC 20868 / MF5171) TaxID=1116229 RepID=S3E6F9_GLAL2|nr:uncharacterized protein GLAREA_06976 [Glarea lozoyensis ATCC 20868]EPE33963.1 hypothetical protein GLAREA_06976 [Glarea lozoyensis ATCC 20868]